MFWQSVLQIFLLVVGFLLLVKGADFFVDGASGIAGKMHISSFIIGLTVVAVGTSTPEAAVSVVGAIQGNGDMIVGNVVGSNILNILLILGICALICNIPVEKSSQYIEIPFLAAITALFIALGFIGDGYEWWDGLILILVYLLFMAYTILMARRTKPVLDEGAITSIAATQPEEMSRGGFKGLMTKASVKYDALKDKVWFLIVITVAGLGMVVGGAQLVVNAASFIATDLLSIPEKTVALTVVAFGTSLPELVTSVSAARKGDMGIATGNIIGSNIANILLIAGLGFVCSAQPIGFVTNDLIDAVVSIGAAVVLLVSSVNKKRSLTRIAGIIMIACLAGYYVYLFMR